MPKRLLAILVLILFATTCISFAQSSHSVHQPTLTPQTSNTTNSLIAVSPVNDRVVWASGRAGTFVVTTDGGKTWKAGVVPGAEALQFRDVQGVSDTVAYLLSIGNGTDSRIYKTVDGGKNWTMQFQNQNASAFYDCFAFWTPNTGITHGDSVDGKFLDLQTWNGKTWNYITDHMPPALPGEASFASSGTCIATQGLRFAWIATGGATPSRILATTDAGDTWTPYATPLRGSPSAGVYSVAFRNPRHGFIGGGDLDATQPPAPQTARSSDGGKTWTLTPAQPNIGTVFGLSYVKGTTLLHDSATPGSNNNDDNPGEASAHAVVVTGPGGSAWSPDEGNSWYTFPNVTGYWGVAFASDRTGWLVGTNGTILKVTF